MQYFSENKLKLHTCNTNSEINSTERSYSESFLKCNDLSSNSCLTFNYIIFYSDLLNGEVLLKPIVYITVTSPGLKDQVVCLF